MPKKVILVGHCGADTAYLKLAVKKAVPDIDIRSADDEKSLNAALAGNDVDLVLFNRELGYGFKSDQGVDAVRSLHIQHANVKMMVITNYPDVQQAAVQAGATPGFGKREIGTARVTELLREALGEAVAKSAGQ